MATKIYKGKCPNCCPDGEAIFSAHGYGNDRSKQCQNCGHVVKLRKRPVGTGNPTKSQQRVINKIVSLFNPGGTPEISILNHSRTAWISLKNYDRPFLVGESLFGTIGPNGAFKITLQRGLSIMEKITLTIECQQNGEIKTTTCCPTTSVSMWTKQNKLELGKFRKARDVSIGDCLMETILLPEITHRYWWVTDIKKQD